MDVRDRASHVHFCQARLYLLIYRGICAVFYTVTCPKVKSGSIFICCAISMLVVLRVVSVAYFDLRILNVPNISDANTPGSGTKTRKCLVTSCTTVTEV